MRPTILLFLSLAIPVAGCQKSDLLPERSSDTVVPRGSQERPFKGSMYYDYIQEQTGPACSCGDVPGDLSPGIFTGYGQMTHLGLVSSDISFCVVEGGAVGCADEGNYISRLCLTFIGADGDELYLDFEPFDYCFNEEGAYGVAYGDIIGGTGTFENVTGSFEVDIDKPFFETLVADFDGHIVY